MIVLDMIKKIDVLITHKHYSLENGIFTLQIDVGDYDLTNKTITAKFNPSKVETGALEVVDGAIQIPIYSSMVQYGINYIQLNFRWDENKLEQSGKLVWIIDNSLETEGVAEEEVDIISYLINEIKSAKATADRMIEDAGDVRIELDESTASATAINDTLADPVTGTIKLATDANATLSQSIIDAGVAKDALTDPMTGAIVLAEAAEDTLTNPITGAIKLAEDAKSDIEQAIIDNEIVTQTEYIAHKEEYTNQRQQDQLKVATVEKELNDYKSTLANVNPNQEAKQSVSGCGTISLPKNTANGQVSVSVKGNTGTNLIKNGDFANGITGWEAPTLGTLIASNNELEVTITNTSNTTTLSYIGQAVKKYANHNYYTAFEIKPKYNNAVAVLIGNKWSENVAPTPNIFNRVSRIVKPTEDTNHFNTLRYRHDVNTNYVVGDKIYFKNILLIDLTQTFGAGNEPTVEECDKIFANWFDETKSTISASRLKSVDKDGIQESTSYLPNVGELRSLPNGTKDEVSLAEGKKTQRVSDEYLVQANNAVYFASTLSTHFDVVLIENLPNRSWGGDALGVVRIEGMSQFTGSYGNGTVDDVGKFRTTSLGIGILVEKNKYTNLTQAREDIANNLSLTYQLATPIVTPIEVSGTLLSYPSGTVYVEHGTYAVGLYGENGITVTESELPIKTINKITKIDYQTGLEHELDVSKAIISEDGLLFTHEDLEGGDIVFFDYDYSTESTQGETTIEYYDSRYVIEDTENGNFYQWKILSTNGTPSIELVEV